ncbi:MAG TPA: NUDIX domain-containing protein [Flavobacteriales bacterium]|nr:NUDIX domain-containing protein [Flavobacteriales bacterium]
MNIPVQKFNIRVYGLLHWEGRVLLSDEHFGGMDITKFPGGGLEWGEGITDCLKREFFEELSLEIIPGKLFFINDFFLLSAFNPNHQVIGIYYLVSCNNPERIPVANVPFAYAEKAHGSQSFRWIDLKELTPEHFHFPLDKMVAEKLMTSGV